MPVKGFPPGTDFGKLQDAHRKLTAEEEAAGLRREIEGLRWARIGAYAGIAGVVIAVIALAVAAYAVAVTLRP